MNNTGTGFGGGKVQHIIITDDTTFAVGFDPKGDSIMPATSDEPINPEELDAYNAWRVKQGLPMVPIKHPKKTHTVSVSNPAWEGLDALAIEFGFTHSRSGNISELLEAIGQRVIKLEAPNHHDG